MNDLFRIVEHGDVATLKEIIHSGSIDINACIADGSTILHYACTIGNPAIVSTLLSHPNIILDATNSDGNTPLHVAAAYTHLAIVKLLIKAGNTPHSIFSHNIKGKLPIDYAVHPEVHSYLESCMSIHDQIYNFTPDPNVLKKYIIDLTIEWSEFQLRAQEVIHEQIEQKQIALHKLHLVERATGVTDSNGAASVIDHLALLQDENDRLTSELMEIRRKMAILEEHLQEHERSEANDASAGDADAPAETAGSSPAAAGASEDSVNMLNTAYENQARVDAEDEKNGLIVYVKNASSETSPNTRRQIRGATKEKLVARLAAYGGPSDPAYLDSFLESYQAFITPEELLSSLIATFNNAPLSSIAHKPVRLRVVNSIKKWVDNYAVDFLENPEMTKTLQAFMSSIDPSDTASVLHLGRALDRLLANNPADRNGRGRGGALSVEELTQSEVSAVALARARLDQAKDSSQGGQDRQGTNLDRLIGRWANPRPSAPIAGTRYASFLEIDPLEFARQLTMIEFELFCQIRAQDFHDLAWMSKNKETLAFGATQLTRWSTRISHWVITEIVSHTSDIKARAQCYERFLVIAGHLDKMNNFNGCIEILTALNSSPVYRLKNTVAYLPTKVRRESEKLFRSFSSDLNYKNLRQRVQQHNDVPLIPFPGVYMQDLVFLDGGAKNFLDEDKGVINFIKHATASRYITSLLKHQKLEYTFEIKKEIRDFICTGLPIIQSEDEHYNLSLQCEPRGTN